MTSGEFIFAGNVQYRGKYPPVAALPTLQNYASSQQQLSNRVAFTYGTGSGNINTIVSTVYELAASGSNTHNLFDGTVPDIFGVASGFANIKFLEVYLIANSDASTPSPSITIGNAAADPQLFNLAGTTPTYQHFYGGQAFMVGKPAGYTIDNTHKNLKVLNDSGSLKASYRLIIGGVKV